MVAEASAAVTPADGKQNGLNPKLERSALMRSAFLLCSILKCLRGADHPPHLAKNRMRCCGTSVLSRHFIVLTFEKLTFDDCACAG
jgi:hypothetical protein